MASTKIIAVYFECHMTLVIQRGQNSCLINFEPAGVYTYHCALKDKYGNNLSCFVDFGCF
jgi:hypothetical protein